MKQTYLLFLFILCIIHQNMLSQSSSENFQSVKQNYEGTIYVPFSMEQLSKISQIDDKTIRVSLANSKQTDVISYFAMEIETYQFCLCTSIPT
ncbi:MAG: hypothetical protein J5767_14375 [Paludibacteraceae bacterium]|nr:hypothetical protein [Paludibacteraceae bacterium]